MHDLQTISDVYDGDQVKVEYGNPSVMICCPSHDSKSKKTKVTYDTSSSKYLATCYTAGCAGDTILRAIQDRIPEIKVFSAVEKWCRVLPDNAPNPKLAPDSTNAWHYRDTQGRYLGYVNERIDLGEGKKRFAQHTAWEQDGVISWKRKGPPKHHDRPTRLMYGLEQLQKRDRPIVIVEGEKAADCGMMIGEGLIFLTPGNSKNYAYVDWQDVIDYKPPSVVLWPDNDAPGQDALKTPLAMLAEAGIRTSVVDVHRLPPAGDICDVTSDTALEMIRSSKPREDGRITLIHERCPEAAARAWPLDVCKAKVCGEYETCKSCPYSFMDRIKFVGDLGDLANPPWMIDHVFIQSTSTFRHLRLNMEDIAPVFSTRVLNQDSTLKPHGAESAAIRIAEATDLLHVYKSDFHPEQPPIFFNECLAYNTWTPPVLREANGEPDMWIKLMHYIFDTDESFKHAMDFCAYTLQKPGSKIGHAMLVQSAEGVGKDYAFKFMRDYFGRHSTTVGTAELESNFNAWADGAKWVQFEELAFGRDRMKHTDALKALISTQPGHININDKGVKVRTVNNLMSIVAFTNREKPISLEGESRRWFIHKCRAPQLPNTPEWDMVMDYVRSEQSMHDIVQYLLLRDVSEFRPDAAPPKTENMAEMVRESNALYSYVEDVFHDHEPPFHNDITTAADVKRYLMTDHRVPASRCSAKAVASLFKALGMLQYGTGQVRMGGQGSKQIRPWVVRNHGTWMVADRKTVIDEYTNRSNVVPGNFNPPDDY